jgi:putative ATP-binding cassette transporter
MKLLSLLQKTSGTSFIGAVFAGLVSGVSSTGLIGLVNYAIAEKVNIDTLTVISYISLCVLMLVSIALSRIIRWRFFGVIRGQ